MMSDYDKLLTIYLDDDGYEVEGRVKIDLAKNNILNIKTSENINKIIAFATDDEPRLFHIRTSARSSATGDATVSYLKDTNGNIKEFYIRIGMRYDKYSTYADEMNTMEIRVNNILTAVGDTSKMSKAQVVRKLQEEYLATVSYGQKGSPSDMRGSFLKPADTYYGYYKVLCEGYSRSMLYLLQRLGFKAIYINGSAFDGVKNLLHAWNKVEIDGKWYNLDSTWDDDKPGNSTASYKYDFLKSDADFSTKHPGPQKDQDGANTGYLMFGVTLPASATKSLTPAEYN